MTITRTEIGEHDVVALLDTFDGWPAGTKGTVVSVFPHHRWVEISNEWGEELDTVSVPPEHLRLVWKCPPPKSKPAAD